MVKEKGRAKEKERAHPKIPAGRSATVNKPFLPFASNTILSAFAYPRRGKQVETYEGPDANIREEREGTNFCNIVRIQLFFWKRHPLIYIDQIYAVVNSSSTTSKHEFLNSFLNASVYYSLSTSNVYFFANFCTWPRPRRCSVEYGGGTWLSNRGREGIEGS